VQRRYLVCICLSTPTKQKKGATVSHHGQAIGNYLGRPIFESIEVQDESYVFDRIAEYEDDEFPLDRLSADELLVEPGLIYRHKD
jgi:hypothetical protein